jgi:hypothetical protein
MAGNGSQNARRDAALIYAEQRLSAWASWAREGRAALGLPSVSTLYKAMRRKAVRIRSKRLELNDPEAALGPRLTAHGVETRSFAPHSAGEIPEAIAEVDQVVANLRPDLHEVIIADYFTYGPIEVRCRQTRFRRARYSQLLEAARYSVYASLAARQPIELAGLRRSIEHEH